MIFLERGEDFIPLAAIIQQATNRRWILKLSSISSREQIMTLQKCPPTNAVLLMLELFYLQDIGVSSKTTVAPNAQKVSVCASLFSNSIS